MKTSIYLTNEDRQSLRTIIECQAAGSKPTQEQQVALEEILSQAKEPSAGDEAMSWVGLGDRLSLVSPKDSNDYFHLKIVMPGDADPDKDLVSVLLPISLALIGRRCGENVSWETPVGERKMRIVSVQKAGLAFA